MKHGGDLSFGEAIDCMRRAARDASIHKQQGRTAEKRLNEDATDTTSKATARAGEKGKGVEKSERIETAQGKRVNIRFIE